MGPKSAKLRQGHSSSGRPFFAGRGRPWTRVLENRSLLLSVAILSWTFQIQIHSSNPHQHRHPIYRTENEVPHPESSSRIGIRN